MTRIREEEDWLEVRRSDDKRCWAYCTALDDAGQDVCQFRSVALKSVVQHLRMNAVYLCLMAADVTCTALKQMLHDVIHDIINDSYR